MSKQSRTITQICTKLLSDARYRAEQRGLDFDLDAEWLMDKLVAGTCELSGVLLDFTAGHPFAPSLDRHRSEAGYLKWNTQVVCHMANKAASNWSKAWLMIFASAYVEKNFPHVPTEELKPYTKHVIKQETKC